MALVVPPPNDKKRVKVYELRNNDWFDRGTGFCTGRVINVRDAIGHHGERGGSPSQAARSAIAEPMAKQRLTGCVGRVEGIRRV